MILESYLEGVVLGLKEGLPFEVITEVFNNSGARCNVADATIRIFNEAAEKYADEDFSAIAKLLEENAKVKIKYSNSEKI